MTRLIDTDHTRRHWFAAILLASLLLLTGASWYFTPKIESRPVGVSIPAPENPVATEPPTSRRDDKSSHPSLASATSFTPFLDVIPSQDGTEIFINAGGTGKVGGTVVANVSVGGSSHKGHTMTYSDTVQAYVTTATGFAQNLDQDGNMYITTNLGQATQKINFKRAFVQTSDPEKIPVDDFTVDMPNPGTFPTDAYLLAMSTNTPPGSLPIGYNFVGSTYNMRPSGSLTQSEKFMTLTLGFQEPLPNGSDPHTLAFVGWDQLNKTWDILGGDLFDNTNQLVLATKRFRIYALATTPTWRDSFKELSLTGVSNRNNTVWGPGDTIILSTGATSGTVTSIPITPTSATNWGTLHFSATTSPSTDLTVDILDLNDTVVLANANDGADLSGLPVSTSLKLRATLTRSTTAEPTPELHEWSVEWEPKVYSIYLPVVLKGT